MHLNILSPDQTLYEGDIQKLLLPGKDGKFGILKGHAPLISALQEGVVKVTDNNGSEEEIGIKGGVIEVKQDRVIVLAEA